MPSDQHFFNRPAVLNMTKTGAHVKLVNPMKNQAKRNRERAYAPGKKMLATADTAPQSMAVSNILQAYSQMPPFHLNFRPQAPAVTPQMLNPPVQALQQMPADERAALARVFLSVASKIVAKSDFGGVFLVGTRLRGYLPPEVMQHYNYLKGV